MKKACIGILVVFTAIFSISAYSESGSQLAMTNVGPEAGARTYAQNYKDMVLAVCIANAYKRDGDVAKDVGSSVSALRDWTLYNLDKAPDAIEELVDSYLARDYWNPLVEPEVDGVRFDFLKCLDMYHSKQMDAQVNRLVLNPNRTYRQEISGQP